MVGSVGSYEPTDGMVTESTKIALTHEYPMINENIPNVGASSIPPGTDPILQEKRGGSIDSMENKIQDAEDKEKENKRVYDCEFCGWRFHIRGNLIAHLRRHTGEKPYECGLCHRKFTQSSLLTVHMRTHTGEKPFACDVCGRSFSRSGNLNTHKRTHSKIKPFQCTYCNKQFSQRVNMDLHIRIHTGVKPYRCGVCNRAFTSCSNMRRHWRQIHPSYPEPAVGTMHLNPDMPEKGVFADGNGIYTEGASNMKPESYRSDSYSNGVYIPTVLPVVMPPSMQHNEDFDPSMKDDETRATAAAAVERS